MNSEEAYAIVHAYGEVLENNPPVPIGEESELPFSKAEIVIAIKTLIESSPKNSQEDKEYVEQLWVALLSLLDYVPDDETLRNKRSLKNELISFLKEGSQNSVTGADTD